MERLFYLYNNATKLLEINQLNNKKWLQIDCISIKTDFSSLCVEWQA